MRGEQPSSPPPPGAPFSFAPPDGSGPRRLLLNAADWQSAAASILPRPVYDYYAAGADDLTTLAANPAALAAHRLRPRVLVPVGGTSPATTLLGAPAAAPVVVAPMAMQRMAHPEGEAAVARAAAAVGLPMTLSTMATTSLERVAAAVPGGGGIRWFQLYVFGGAARGVTEALVRRAEAAGYTALVLTADAPVYGNREVDVRNGFSLPSGLRLANFAGDSPSQGEDITQGEADEDAPPGSAIADVDASAESGSGLAAFGDAMLDPDLSTDCIAWLRTLTSLPILVKGVLRADDAAAVMAAGAAGVVVSNHGARQLDGAVTSISALRGVVKAVKRPPPGGASPGMVLVDGGFRRGTDVLKALALGADAVLIGRPVLWALAVGGEAGVVALLGRLIDETRRAMMLAGVPAWDRIPPGLVVLPDGRIADDAPVDASGW
ncbi:hypothetical protein MMPV_001823 [Pyropia vietnamensis]